MGKTEFSEEEWEVVYRVRKSLSALLPSSQRSVQVTSLFPNGGLLTDRQVWLHSSLSWDVTPQGIYFIAELVLMVVPHVPLREEGKVASIIRRHLIPCVHEVLLVWEKDRGVREFLRLARMRSLDEIFSSKAIGEAAERPLTLGSGGGAGILEVSARVIGKTLPLSVFKGAV